MDLNYNCSRFREYLKKLTERNFLLLVKVNKSAGPEYSGFVCYLKYIIGTAQRPIRAQFWKIRAADWLRAPDRRLYCHKFELSCHKHIRVSNFNISSKPYLLFLGEFQRLFAVRKHS